MSGLLNVGKSGLDASRKSLETVGNNIANVNTEGFSRQRVRQQTSPAIIKDGVVTGRGVFIKSVERVQDPLIERRMQSAFSEVEYYKNRAQELEKVEDIFAEIGTDGLNFLINRFYNAFRELANRPGNESIRSAVRDAAKFIVKDFQRISAALDDYVKNINFKIGQDIQKVNEIAESIATLNTRITQMEIDGTMASNLRDQRDLELGRLAKIFKIKTYVDDKGNNNVMAENVGSLVVAGTSQPLKAGMQLSRADNDAPGEMRVFFGVGSGRSVEKKFRGGSLSSLVRARNEDIKKFKDNIDNIAFELANTVNALHRKGFVNREVVLDENGLPKAFEGGRKNTGVDFFKISKSRLGAASSIELSDDVKKDLGNIVTALAPNAPGDNRVALAISKLQHEKITLGGTATLEEAYQQSVSSIGIEARKAQVNREHAEGLVNQIKSFRERISGVSIDEEAANMVRHQHAYNASAKVIQTAGEIFDTILGIKD